MAILVHGDMTLGGALVHRDSLTGFPANPKPYTQVIKDGVPYSYVDMSGGQGTLYSWLPMANKPNTYLHQQGIPASDITVQHNMGTEHVGIFVYDSANGLIIANFDVVDANSIIVHLSEATECNIIVFGYNVIGAATLAGSTVQVGSIELTESVNGNLLINGSAIASSDKLDAILALAPEELDTFKEVATKFDTKADVATTLSGYGITNAYTKSEVDSSLSAKANSATTLSGYGITDAYSKSEVDTMKTQYVLASGGTMTGAITSFREAYQALPASTINLAVANQFSKTITANTTFGVSNVPSSGQAFGFILELTNGGAYTIGYWTGVKWAGGTAPTLTAAGMDILGFYTHDGGATWRGMVLAKDSK